MNKGVIAWVIGLVGLIVSFVIIYFNTGLKSENDLFKAVPDNAGLIFQYENSEEIRNIFKNGNLIKGFLNSEIQEEYYSLEKLFLLNSKIFPEKPSAKILLSFHKIQSNKLDFLCIVNYKSFFNTNIYEALAPFLSPKIILKNHILKGQKIYELEFSEDQKTLTFYIHNGLLVLSWNPFLVENSYLNFNNNKINEDLTNFYSKFNLSNSKSPLKVYINYKEIENFISAGFKSTLFENINPLTGLAQWSFLDLNYKVNTLQFSGYTQINKNSGNCLSNLKNQSPIKQDLFFNLPKSTMSFLTFGISNKKLFFEQIDTSKYKRFFLDKIETEQKEKYKEFNRKLESTFSSEYLIALNENNGFQIEDDYFAMLKIRDFKEIENFLMAEDNYSKLNDSVEVYRGVKIFKNPYSGIFNYTFGSTFENFKSSFIVQMNNFLLSTNNINSLKLFIDYYTTLNTLYNQDDFVQFNLEMGTSANIFFYGNLNLAGNFLSFFSKDDIKKYFSNSGLNYYQSMGLKISSGSSENYFTCLSFPLQSANKKKGLLTWKIDLGTAIQFQPVKVVNHQTGEIEFLVQDDQNKLYLINVNGKIIWRKELEGKILGNIFQIDFYKNDKLQYLFNIKNFIYVMDRNSDFIDGFPKRIGAEANCGLALFDYDLDKNYRFFVPCKNNSIYGFAINGKPLEGWNPKSNLGNIINPIKHSQIMGKDYLFCNTTDGKFYFFNRKGELISKYYDSNNKYLNDFYPDITNNFGNSRFISTDSSGKLRSIYFDGRTLYKSIGSWTTNHFFNYAKMDDKIGNTLIFLDKDQLFVYKNDSTLLWSYQFLVTPRSKPQVFNLSSDNNYIGLSSIESNQIFLFNSAGNVYKGFPLKGSSAFILMENLDNFDLLVGSIDGNLYFYQVPK